MFENLCSVVMAATNALMNESDPEIEARAVGLPNSAAMLARMLVAFGRVIIAKSTSTALNEVSEGIKLIRTTLEQRR